MRATTRASPIMTQITITMASRAMKSKIPDNIPSPPTEESIQSRMMTAALSNTPAITNAQNEMRNANGNAIIASRARITIHHKATSPSTDFDLTDGIFRSLNVIVGNFIL